MIYLQTDDLSWVIDPNIPKDICISLSSYLVTIKNAISGKNKDISPIWMPPEELHLSLSQILYSALLIPSIAMPSIGKVILFRLVHPLRINDCSESFILIFITARKHLCPFSSGLSVDDDDTVIVSAIICPLVGFDVISVGDTVAVAVADAVADAVAVAVAVGDVSVIGFVHVVNESSARTPSHFPLFMLLHS